MRGVGMMLNKEDAHTLIKWKPINEKIITAGFQSRHTKTSVVQVYVPTGDAPETEKNKIYDKLHDTLHEIPSYDLLILLSDMNTQISNDRRRPKHVIELHGSAIQTDDNGDCPLLLSATNFLVIGNTYFTHKSIHKKTWRSSTNGNSYNEINYVCTSTRWKSAMEDVRVYRGTDIGSDYYMVVCILKLKLKKLRKLAPKQDLSVEKLKRSQYQRHISNQSGKEIQNITV